MMQIRRIHFDIKSTLNVSVIITIMGVISGSSHHSVNILHDLKVLRIVTKTEAFDVDFSSK